MKSILKSFKRRISLVMVFFAMAPISFFGLYAYHSLSESRAYNFEQSFFYAFKNDLGSFDLWLEDKEAHIDSDAKLHLLANRNRTKGYFENRYYEIFWEGTEAYNAIYSEAKVKGNSQLLVRVSNYSGLHRVPDERTVLEVYTLKMDQETHKRFYIREDVHLREIMNNLESALSDRFSSYAIFVNKEVLYENKGGLNLDPYTAYFNKDNFATIHQQGRYYMGVYDGSDQLRIHVAVYRDYTQAIHDITDYQRKFAIKTILIGLLGALLAFLIARKANNPIDVLKLAVADILNGKYDRRISEISKDEFGQIYEAFNHLAEIETSNYRKMVESGHLIGEKNTELIAVNQELEVSYEQLREVMTQLDLSRRKQEALINNIGELIWTMTPEGVVTFINQAILDKLGYTPQEVQGELITKFIVEIDNGLTSDQLIEKANQSDLDHLGLYFNKKRSEDRVYMLLSTKRAFEQKDQKTIQCFARAVSDEWLLHHLTMRRNKEMEITGQISWVLANNILLDELLEEIVKKIDQLLAPDLCLIGLVEQDDVTISSVSGAYGSQIGRIRLAVGSTLFVEELSLNALIRGEEIYQYFRVGNEAIYQAISDFVILPLRFDGNVTGFFAIGSSKRLSDSDLKVLQIVCNQSAIAIDKAKLYKTLKDDYLNTIRVLATAVEAKDAYTEGHSYRVSKIAKMIAAQLSADETFIEEIEISGILHDIGKIGIYDKILTKRGRLNDEEYEVIQSHPEVGAKIISPIDLSPTIRDGVLLHHKRYDLQGYPMSVRIKQLPLSAGIIGVADAVDAMTSTRSYSQAKSIEYAIEEVLRHSGTQFHPEAAKALAAIYEINPVELLKIVHEQV